MGIQRPGLLGPCICLAILAEVHTHAAPHTTVAMLDIEAEAFGNHTCNKRNIPEYAFEPYTRIHPRPLNQNCYEWGHDDTTTLIMVMKMMMVMVMMMTTKTR